MTRLPLALLLLVGVCGAQEAKPLPSTGTGTVHLTVPTWWTDRNEYCDRRWWKASEMLRKQLKACQNDMNEAIGGIEQCEAEENKPHLPLGVNPGDCFEVQGDMSLKMIPCPKEGE